MPRRSRSDADAAFDELSGLFSRAPVWVGPVAALLAYPLFRFVFAGALKSFGGDAGKMIGNLLENLAWLGSVFVLGAWIVALVQRSRMRRQFDRQTGLGSIKALSWSEFEGLVGEAFRRQGYAVAETGRPGPDGGVDLVLTKDGEETLVQCKRWKEWQVGVGKVRELYGVMAARGSIGGILVTSGVFTKAARQFAEGKSVRLIDGSELAQLIAGIQAKPGTAVVRNAASPAELVVCPQCGSSMILRTAKKGPQPGSQFWGCTRYPACRSTRPLEVGG